MLEPREEGSDDDDDDNLEEEDRGSRRRPRRKRQAPYIIFPEILCIVDYDGYRFANPETTDIEIGRILTH